MTDFKNIKFSTADIIKAIGGVLFIGSMWMDLKTDQIKSTEERKILQYQIDQLNKKCGLAVLPKEVKIEGE